MLNNLYFATTVRPGMYGQDQLILEIPYTIDHYIDHGDMAQRV